MSQCKTMSVF
ncbi:hypothetical protein F383_00440 [Gossypium arboreum]|uniref:Uncharacterized protein n=1 Tax=Gossypium arboreum TaxID=29729 RepID=A0A0B0P4W9_GOSAR|nr:hypothetical protein F383_00440 [Gossypium arboreum]